MAFKEEFVNNCVEDIFVRFFSNEKRILVTHSSQLGVSTIIVELIKQLKSNGINKILVSAENRLVLDQLSSRMQDLIDVFVETKRYSELQKSIVVEYDVIILFKKQYYYNPRMKNSASIKDVLPAMYPDEPGLSYERLEGIHNGNEATYQYGSAFLEDSERRIQIISQLLKYC